MTVRLSRDLWMEPEITRFHTEWYRELYKVLGLTDPYREIKEQSMAAATALLRRLGLGSLKEHVVACVIANRLDYGAPDLPEGLAAADFARVEPGFLHVDDTDALLADITTAREIVYLADNCGEVVFDLALIERIGEVNPGCVVSLCAKGKPMLNDVTVADLEHVALPANCRVVSTESNCFGVPEDEVPAALRQRLASADLVIAKGQAYLEFWIHYGLETVYNLACTKYPIADAVLGVIPARVGLVLSARRYAAGKRAYGAAVGQGALPR
jgi:uncharacterized protein with ATP-grasp and redox domains